MRRFTYEFGDRPWPSGRGVLQVYALIDLDENPELRALVNAVRKVVRPDGEAQPVLPFSPVADEHLHVTLDLVAGRTIEQIPQGWQDALATGLQAELAGVPAFRGLAGSPLAYNGSIVIDVGTAAPLIDLQARVREAIRRLFGDDACTWRQSKPHVSTHYCHADDVESDPIQRALRQIDPGVVPLTITRLALVNVRPDLATNALGWTTLGDPITLAHGVEPAPLSTDGRR
uniref:2'-5' RNA ligase family protein n=1 Tax=Amycolatopsis sp. CA-096443 TaxID=3239919 RepID=UPI003F492253